MTNILTNLIASRIAEYGGGREAYEYKTDDRWSVVSWDDFKKATDRVACALASLGINPADNMAIFSANCSEIFISDFAAYANRAVPISIYSTSTLQQVEYIVNDAGCKLIIVGNQEQYEIALEAQKKCTTLNQIVTINPVTLDKSDHTTISYDRLYEIGAEVHDKYILEIERRRSEATPDDIATIIYTSGTTGEPKGAVLPHSCFNAALTIHKERLTMLSDSDTSMCFLPLSHIFEKAWSYFCLWMGIRIYINSDPHQIQTAIKEVRPTCMCSVPRFWEKVYTGVQEKIATMSPLSRWMVGFALSIGRKRNLVYNRTGRRAPWLIEKLYGFFYRRIFRPMQKVIGIENGNIFPTAGAPLSANIVEFLHSCGINIVIGYGLSETTATVTCYPQFNYVIGSCGTTLPQIEVKIGADNEILVKAPTIMRGYYNKPEETAEAFTDDGWFRTGDAGYFDEHGDLVLTDRIKDLFKTSNGKYIAPQALESRLGEDRYIEQVAVIGDKRKYVTAIIIPAFEALKEYARKKHIQYRNMEELLKNSDIQSLISERIERLQQNFAGFEKIKKFTLLPQAFTMEAGELTNTLKIRRPVINSRYAREIEAMYV
ncbi:MAG: long-chain fatty acid--CoA ligase [Bacteroides sp.]|nr:long-chain fatty acid--CoA ligase [Bacteroides sp.]MCM1414250.1 long-chain fatty acid--CoA ligase [Bacteroides sp.]MCM1471215.1 long-chain fatty acid--CoA ligase [Bacteroides sp.]